MGVKSCTRAQKRANIRKWVKALRSGKYKQGRRQLRSGTKKDGYSYCCLGVACEVLGVRYRSKNGTLPAEAMAMLGVKNCQGKYTPGDLSLRSLVMDNDHRRESFKQIAKIIESRPKGLFEEGV